MNGCSGRIVENAERDKLLEATVKLASEKKTKKKKGDNTLVSAVANISAVGDDGFENVIIVKVDMAEAKGEKRYLLIEEEAKERIKQKGTRTNC